MKLTEQQMKRVMDTLKNRAGIITCVICKHSDWTLVETLFEVREFSGGALYASGKLLPLVALACKVCGHTLLLNALHLGVVSATPGSQSADWPPPHWSEDK